MKTIILIAGFVVFFLGFVFMRYVLNKNVKAGYVVASLACVVVYLHTGFNSIFGYKLFFAVSFPAMIVLGFMIYFLLKYRGLLSPKINDVL